MANDHQKLVVMTKRVADRWLREVSFPEHRVKVLYGAKDHRNLANLMYAFRDGKVPVEGCPRVADMGVQDTMDGIELWSRDREGLKALVSWFEKRGFETTGLW